MKPPTTHGLTTLAVLTLGLTLAFSSCTCQRDIPPPTEQDMQRQGGWSRKVERKAAPEKRRAVRELPTPRPREEADLGEARDVPADIPADFPQDVPIFEDAEPFAVQELAGQAKNVLFRVDAPAREVYEYYEEKMRDEGWQLEQQYAAREQSFLSFRKGQMIANMTISEDPKTGRQVVGIMYQEEDELPFPEF